MPTSVQKHGAKSGDIYLDYEQQLLMLINSLDDCGRIGYDYIDYRIDDAIDSLVTARNRMQAIIAYAKQNNIVEFNTD